MRNVKIEYLKALSLGEVWERLLPVDEYKPAGTYEVEFNISSISGSVSAKGGSASSVYFYQLKVTDPESSLPTGQAGSGKGFVETKKMILLK
jgi:hypothetical protein